MLSPANIERDLPELFAVLLRQEETTYRCSDYLCPEHQARNAHKCHESNILNSSVGSCSTGSSSSSGISEIWREKICEWSFQVVDHFDFNRETVSVSLNYLDRYLSTRPVNRKIFQLAAMTSLYIAIKLYEPGMLKLSCFVELSRGYFSAEHIIAMEDAILRALHWHVHPPTSLCFIRHFMMLIPENSCSPLVIHEIKELSRFLTELSVCDYFFTTQKPSSIALAAILIALESVNEARDPLIRHSFMNRVHQFAGVNCMLEEVEACKARLRETYNSGGCTRQEVSDYEMNVGNDRIETGEVVSPVCVSDISQSRTVKQTRTATFSCPAPSNSVPSSRKSSRTASKVFAGGK